MTTASKVYTARNSRCRGQSESESEFDDGGVREALRGTAYRTTDDDVRHDLLHERERVDLSFSELCGALCGLRHIFQSAVMHR
jgi:hypothetical protein